MKNPIIKSDLFKTPTSIEQLMEIAESMTNSSEAWQVMVFTLNYCYLMVEEEIKSTQRIRVVSKVEPEWTEITDTDIAKNVQQLCVELDADAYMEAQQEELSVMREACAPRRE